MAKRAHEQISLIAHHEFESLNEWDFEGEDTQYLTHAIHPYLASMIPQIPKKLLEMYSNSNAKVFDPFVGGGAVLVEAYLANLKAVGYDINPIAVIISKAKTTFIPENILFKILTRFDNIYVRSEPDLPKFPPSARIDYWFKRYEFKPLARLRTAIKNTTELVDDKYRESVSNLMACVFSNTIRDVSLTYRGEVRLRCLQGKDYDNFNPDVFNEFKKRMIDSFHRVCQLPRNRQPRVMECDSRNVPVKDKYFDIVITSPPYGDIKNTIPYHQFSKNMIYWLGLGDNALNLIRRRSLGAKDGNKKTPKSRTLKKAISLMSKPNLIHEAVCFYADYYEALVEITRVTKHRIIIIMGHRILDGIVVDNPSITTDFMKNIGWENEVTFKRSIKKKRLNKKMGFGNNAMGGTIDTEKILVYVPKP